MSPLVREAGRTGRDRRKHLATSRELPQAEENTRRGCGSMRPTSGDAWVSPEYKAYFKKKKIILGCKKHRIKKTRAYLFILIFFFRNLWFYSFRFFFLRSPFGSSIRQTNICQIFAQNNPVANSHRKQKLTCPYWKAEYSECIWAIDPFFPSNKEGPLSQWL